MLLLEDLRLSIPRINHTIAFERDERSLRAAQDVLATAQAKQMEDEQELIYLFQALYKCQNEAKGLSEKTPLIF
ncbi:MAG: hypothetical protein WDO13_18215 [Verrucomicrobiota bacterium]